jgi:hypothetical protein
MRVFRTVRGFVGTVNDEQPTVSVAAATPKTAPPPPSLADAIKNNPLPRNKPHGWKGDK